MLDTIGLIVAGAVTSVTSYGVWMMHRHDSPSPAIEPQWQAVREPDGSWSVLIHETIPALGINEATAYGGYSEQDASVVARWLNDREDFRTLPQVLLDARAERKARAEEMEKRRLAGGEPIYVMGHAEPVDYICHDQHQQPYAPPSDLCAICARPHSEHEHAAGARMRARRRRLEALDSATQDRSAEMLSHWSRKKLEAFACQKHHLTLAQMKLISKTELVRLLAYDEPPPAPSTEDLYTEYDIRQALYAWRESVRKNAPGDDWTVEQREQLHFIAARAAQLGLKHVVLSVKHGDPTTFDEPQVGIPTRTEWR